MKRASVRRKVAVEVRPLRSSDWPAMEKLFGERGACGGCWCMWWRVPRGGELWDKCKGAPNKLAFKKLVQSGRARGVLAFDGGEPVGWCSFGPRAEFPRTERIKALRAEWDEGTWSINCFYIPTAWRGRGVASRLLDAAIELARKNGARELEGYPVRARAGGDSKVPAAFAWTGVPEMFERCGFVEQSSEPSSHRLYRRGVAKAARGRR